jgi:hypothetical protein
MIDTAGWNALAASPPAVRISLPAKFKADTSAVFGVGGTRWRDGPRSVDAERGYWDTTAFRPRRGERVDAFAMCYAEIDGRRILLTTTLANHVFSASAWPVAAAADSDRVTTALVARGTDRADQDLFLRAFRSATWAPNDSAR